MTINEIKTIIKQVLHDRIGENQFNYEYTRQWNTKVSHRLDF